MADSGLHCMRHLAGCLMALAITSSHARPPGDMYDRLAAVNATPGDDGKFRKLDALYRDDATQALGRLEALDAAELSKLFSATDMLAFYAQYEDREALMRYIQRMSAVYEELARRSIASEPQANAMLDALLGARLFDEARSLRESSAALLLDRDVPAVVFAPGFRSDDSAVLMLQPDGALLARNVDRTGSHLVAVVGCRASRRALDEINALPALVEALDRIPVFWLVPADRMTDPGFLREWNARFPRQPAVFAYANAAWKGVAFQSMAAIPAVRRRAARRAVGWLGARRRAFAVGAAAVSAHAL